MKKNSYLDISTEEVCYGEKNCVSFVKGNGCCEIWQLGLPADHGASIPFVNQASQHPDLKTLDYS